MTLRSHLFLIVTCLLPAFLVAQKSDLYLFDFLQIAGKYELHHPRLLSDFNADGYTNQPAFIDNYTLLVAAAPASDLVHTDIFKLDLRNNNLTQITKTTDREYSPTLAMADRNFFNCVVVEVENNDKQIIWQYPLDRSDGGKPLVRDLENVGYFREMPNNWIAIFEVGSPNKLWLVNKESGERKFISSNIGRSFHVLKNGQLAYLHKFSAEYWFLKRLNPDTLLSEIIKKALPGSEDFIVLEDDSILMGQGSKLYHLNQYGDNQWTEIANLENYGISHITRLAFNGINQLVITDQKVTN